MPDDTIMRLIWLKNRLLSEIRPSKGTLEEINKELQNLREKLNYLGDKNDSR